MPYLYLLTADGGRGHLSDCKKLQNQCRDDREVLRRAYQEPIGCCRYQCAATQKNSEVKKLWQKLLSLRAVYLIQRWILSGLQKWLQSQLQIAARYMMLQLRQPQANP